MTVEILYGFLKDQSQPQLVAVSPRHKWATSGFHMTFTYKNALDVYRKLKTGMIEAAQRSARGPEAHRQ